MNLPNILVVDDDSAAREILSETVEQVAARVKTAGSAAEALAQLAADPADIVLSDIDMPGGSGTDLLRSIKQSAPDTEVIMVTGVTDVTTAIRAIRLGAADYVTKPFNLDEVRITVERTWEKRRLILENRAYQQNLEVKVAERTRELRQAYREIEETYQSTLEALIQALDMRDTETQGHSLRVVEYTIEIARAMGVAEPDLTEIGRGALLHDIGKIGVRDAVLRKPGKLTAEEWIEMRTHPELGYHMLGGIKFLDKPREIVLAHQEKFDGTGYPRGLKGGDIPLGARIFSVADTLDAMTTNRVYRSALSYEKTRQEMIDFSGTQFDPAVVEAFLRIPPARWDELRQGVATRIAASASKIEALNLLMPPALVAD